MAKLTNNQKEFLLDTFFVTREFVLWRDVATKLLETGKCIVPTSDRIWVGGIGSFISCGNSDEAIGCMLYEFDLDTFLQTKFYVDVKESYVENLLNEQKEANKKLSEIKSLGV